MILRAGAWTMSGCFAVTPRHCRGTAWACGPRRHNDAGASPFDGPASFAGVGENLGNLASHHWMLGYFQPEAQDEIWDLSRDTLIATSLVFLAGRGRKADGGY